MAGSKDTRATFECLGANIGGGNEDVVGDCLFCGKEDHFFLNVQTGQWDCKRCGLEGNIVTFMGKVAEQAFKETHSSDWVRLAHQRSILQGQPVDPPLPVDVFRRYRMGWTGQEWYIPCFSEKGTVRDIRRWNGHKVMSTAGRQLQLFGMMDLARTPVGTTVWVCEGEWDAMCLRWLLDQSDRIRDVVVGVPGAMVFKKEWSFKFKGMHAIFCYDNDPPGDAGSLKAGDMVLGIAADVKYLCWPDARPNGWDIKDFVLEGRGGEMTAAEGVRLLREMTKPTHRRARAISPEEAAAVEDSGIEEKPAAFKEVLATFKSWVKVDRDFHDALVCVLAVCLANDIPGDPVWLYLVGPPGSGKTLILMSVQESERTMFYSTLTPASLVSGFNVSPDPSLLPELNGKTAVFKDGTELTAMHPDARREIYGVLRGAFDGHVLKRFGNGVLREYRLHFNMIIGVTPVIHADSQATMGERFLKMEMRDDDTDDKVRRALGNLTEEFHMQQDLCGVCKRFLSRKIDPSNMPAMSDEVIDRIVAMAQLVAILRAQVDRESYGDRDLRYRPVHEVGTRVAKQLAKLGQMITYILDRPEIDDEILRILRKVSYDTTVGFHLDIVRRILVNSNSGMTRHTIAKESKISETTVGRRLVDLEQLGVLERLSSGEETPTQVHMRRGPKPALWCVSERVAQLWESSAAPLREPRRPEGTQTGSQPLRPPRGVFDPSGGRGASGAG